MHYFGFKRQVHYSLSQAKEKGGNKMGTPQDDYGRELGSDVSKVLPFQSSQIAVMEIEKLPYQELNYKSLEGQINSLLFILTLLSFR